MNLKPLAFVLTTSALLVGGCSLFKGDFEPFTSVAPTPLPTTTATPEEPKLLTEVESQALAPKKDDVNDTITIKWVVPEQALDGYVIRYGFAATSLDYEERVSWNQLAIDALADGKKIFIHTLRGLPTDRAIFISLAGVKEDHLSPSTAIFSVQPVAGKTTKK